MGVEGGRAGPVPRARHTHRAYLQAGLGKWEAKLARVRQGGPDALARWDKALDGVATEEDARWLLDAAIRAAEDRLWPLGLPPVDDDEDGVVLDGVAPLNFAAAAGDHYGLLHDAVGGSGDANNGQQAMRCTNGFHFPQGGAADAQLTGYGFQTYTSGGGAGVERATILRETGNSFVERKSSDTQRRESLP